MAPASDGLGVDEALQTRGRVFHDDHGEHTVGMAAVVGGRGGRGVLRGRRGQWATE